MPEDSEGIEQLNPFDHTFLGSVYTLGSKAVGLKVLHEVEKVFPNPSDTNVGSIYMTGKRLVEKHLVTVIVIDDFKDDGTPRKSLFYQLTENGKKALGQSELTRLDQLKDKSN